VESGVEGRLYATGAEGPAGVGGGRQGDHVAVVIGGLVGVVSHRAVADDVDRQGVPVRGEYRRGPDHGSQRSQERC
jgi:hypothetical protein